MDYLGDIMNEMTIKDMTDDELAAYLEEKLEIEYIKALQALGVPSSEICIALVNSFSRLMQAHLTREHYEDILHDLIEAEWRPTHFNNSIH